MDINSNATLISVGVTVGAALIFSAAVHFLGTSPSSASASTDKYGLPGAFSSNEEKELTVDKKKSKKKSKKALAKSAELPLPSIPVSVPDVMSASVGPVAPGKKQKRDPKTSSALKPIPISTKGSAKGKGKADVTSQPSPALESVAVPVPPVNDISDDEEDEEDEERLDAKNERNIPKGVHGSIIIVSPDTEDDLQDDSDGWAQVPMSRSIQSHSSLFATGTASTPAKRQNNASTAQGKNAKKNASKKAAVSSAKAQADAEQAVRLAAHRKLLADHERELARIKEAEKKAGGKKKLLSSGMKATVTETSDLIWES